ncbi:XrtA/PEP-CTERM system TPR-repeat protein PrsT [Aestuariispira ectoiniformans]|uniref:XrtA/PEP-CTERM system TPR-repeat protein PrsT n=1 Tax=Aestuariispira ectoiniformans TaxID=2775080 RepID=UPI00223B6F9E|nr:XrtA/PEP-CTERM system TPR-repeat protein PrsT [Aestuariispira ectoiniformans]
MRGITKIAAVCATAVTMMMATPVLAAVDSDTQEILKETQSYLEKGEYKAAVIELKNAIRDDPKNPHLRFQLGRIYLSAGDGLGAEKEFNVALENGIDPSIMQVPLAQTYLVLRRYDDVLNKTSVEKTAPGQKAQILTTHSQALLEKGKLAEAEKLAQQAVQEEPTSPRATDALAVVMLREKRIEEAESLIDTFLAAHEGDAALLFRKGEIRRSMKDADGAINFYNRALSYNRSYVPALSSRALSWLSLGETEKAQQDIETILTDSPGNPFGRYLKALIAFRDQKTDEANDLLVATGPALDEYAPALFLNAAVRFARGDLEQAQSYIQRFLTKVPENPNGLGVLGGIYMQRGETHRAVQVLERAERIAPEDFTVLTLLGQAYMSVGQFSDASEMFDRARQINPDATVVSTQYAISQIGMGNSKTGVEDLEKLAEREDGQRALFALVTVYTRDGKYDKALAAIDKMKMPDSPIPDYFRADIARLKGDPDTARAGYEQVIKAYPKFAPARLSLASLDVLDGNLDAAEERLTPVLKEGETNIRAQIAMARIAELRANYKEAERLLRGAIQKESRQSRLWVELVALLMRSENTDEALAAATEFSVAFPDSPTAQEMLVRAQLAAGKQDEALQTMGRLVRLAPRSVPALVQHARMLLAAGDATKARQSVERALELDPKSEQARSMLVDILLQSEGVDAALKSVVENAEGASPETVALSRGDLLMRKQQYGEAVKAYNKVLETDQRAFIAARKYQAMSQAGQPDEALAWLQDWTKSHPEDMDLRLYYASTLMGLGKTEDAAKEYVALTKDDPKNAIAWNNAAWLYEQMGRPDSMDLAKKAYDAAPNSPAIADTYGWLLFKRGKVDESLDLMKRAYVRAPENAEITYHYAAVLNAAGDVATARQYLEKAVNTSATYPEKGDAEALLAKLNGN